MCILILCYRFLPKIILCNISNNVVLQSINTRAMIQWGVVWEIFSKSNNKIYMPCTICTFAFLLLLRRDLAYTCYRHKKKGRPKQWNVA
jgi:hypothetical protein